MSMKTAASLRQVSRRHSFTMSGTSGRTTTSHAGASCARRPCRKVIPHTTATTLGNYGTLVTQIRRQFEMMVPEMFRKVRKLEDGEEIDIDDIIEAFVDMKTGASPSDKFYWRRNKVQRDVAVAFLLDTSASTAEAIDDTRKKQ